MQLRMLCQLEELSERLRKQRGLDCRYCGVLHTVGQCQHPKNWGKQGRSASAIFDANEAGEHDRYLRQLERRLERERVLSIKL